MSLAHSFAIQHPSGKPACLLEGCTTVLTSPPHTLLIFGTEENTVVVHELCYLETEHNNNKKMCEVQSRPYHVFPLLASSGEVMIKDVRTFPALFPSLVFVLQNSGTCTVLDVYQKTVLCQVDVVSLTQSFLQRNRNVIEDDNDEPSNHNNNRNNKKNKNANIIFNNNNEILCNALAVSPKGDQLAVSYGSDVVILDLPTLLSNANHHHNSNVVVHYINGLHTEEITKLLFLQPSEQNNNPYILCTCGEDLMINFISTLKGTVDDDVIISGSRTGEGDVATKLHFWQLQNNNNNNNNNNVPFQFFSMIGTCENGYVFPANMPTFEEKEFIYKRPDYDTYLIDFFVLPFSYQPHCPAALYLCQGRRNEDGESAGLELMDLSCFQQQASQHLLPYGNPLLQGWQVNNNNNQGDNNNNNTLFLQGSAAAHREICRVALPIPFFNAQHDAIGDSLFLTASEDGSVAVWDLDSRHTYNNNKNNSNSGGVAGKRTRE
ncbi:hypothetical protein ADEAN_000359200 [Angomonas deanei]|uniref:Uncharacterized protein n=1 Tax=Angomonas deanei TaxID=59799 RepID=A0A7G2CAN1_9TRYP|nr:hypothetical protein ADEAN_000359200 [Angomonas deanei]